LSELLRKHQQFGGKTLKTFTVLKAVSGSAGVTRSFSANRQINVQVLFTDGSSGLVRIDVP
jgi:hypothetical protein